MLHYEKISLEGRSRALTLRDDARSIYGLIPSSRASARARTPGQKRRPLFVAVFLYPARYAGRPYSVLNKMKLLITSVCAFASLGT